MAPTPMKTIHGIQYLRALAALGVVLFHAAERTGHHFAIGAAGVDVFFVISGFIMWVISDRRPTAPLAFLRERLRRIAPIYWLATLVMIGGGVAGLFPNLVLTVRTCRGVPDVHPRTLAKQRRDLAGACARMDTQLRNVLLRRLCGIFDAAKTTAGYR